MNPAKSSRKKGPGPVAKRSILVTSALPYANGPIHLGHLVEHVQTDIWVRFQKLAGHQVYYFCADDTHGTPIMLAARREGISPDDLVKRIHGEHFRDLSYFNISFNNYYTTNSPENRDLASHIYNESARKGHINRKPLEQLYCEHDTMFLPDRFVRGTCPVCGAVDQYGDSCEICGATYNPEDLKDAKCSLCGTPPVKKSTEHLFFRLGDFQEFLTQWLATGHVDEGVRKKMHEWIDAGLRDWDISRDGPYFGFEIPGEKEKYFYVWLDAPIGYIASSKNYFETRGETKLFDAFWNRDSEAEVYHFIGKDIAYFHTLFWPALLTAGGFRTPSAVFVHGFLTVDGEKMSKSRGTLIRASTYARHLPPDPLRYYYASRLSAGLDDLDFTVEEFVNRYNSDIVGNLTNIYSRLCSGIAAKLEHRLSPSLSVKGEGLRVSVLEGADRILEHYENRSYAKAMRELLSLADEVNRYVSEEEPWKSVKTDAERARQTITDALTAGRILAGLVQPVLPDFAAKVESLLRLPEPVHAGNLEWLFPKGHTIAPYEHLASRIDPKDVEKVLLEEKETAMKAASEKKVAVSSPESVNKGQEKKMQDKKTIEKTNVEKPATPEGIITIDDLAKVELRAGRILEAELVEGADRLLRIKLDLGEEKPRQVIAGIRVAYKPEDLKGITVVAVANLQPRTMKFGTSEAMLLAAGEGETLTLFVPHRSAKPGDRLR